MGAASPTVPPDQSNSVYQPETAHALDKTCPNPSNRLPPQSNRTQVALARASGIEMRVVRRQPREGYSGSFPSRQAVERRPPLTHPRLATPRAAKGSWKKGNGMARAPMRPFRPVRRPRVADPSGTILTVKFAACRDDIGTALIIARSWDAEAVVEQRDQECRLHTKGSLKSVSNFSPLYPRASRTRRPVWDSKSSSTLLARRGRSLAGDTSDHNDSSPPRSGLVFSPQYAAAFFPSLLISSSNQGIEPRRPRPHRCT